MGVVVESGRRLGRVRRNGRGGLGGLGVGVVVVAGLGVVDVRDGEQDGSAAAGGFEGAVAEGVAVDVGEEEVEGAGNAAFFGAALEAVEDAGEAEGGDEVGLGEFDEVECVGEGFAAFEGEAPAVDEVVDDRCEGGLGAEAGVCAFEAAEGG